jgi:hypothetical protein
MTSGTLCKVIEETQRDEAQTNYHLHAGKLQPEGEGNKKGWKETEGKD